MQTCSRCQTENSDDSRSCAKCGTSLERTTFGRRVTLPGQDAADSARGSESSSSTRTCPSCGAPSPGTTQFCSACGKAFDGRAVSGTAPSDVEYASFGRRLAGYLVDFTILLVIAGIPSAFVPGLGGSLTSFVISFSYSVLLNANGGTLGMRMLDMRVQNKDTGEDIGIGTAVIRYFIAIISALAILIGYFWMLWDPNKQTWHDKAAGSVVVKT